MSRPASRGFLVVLEGADGTGKTTMARRLAAHLKWHFSVYPDRTTPAGVLIDRMLKERLTLAGDDVTDLDRATVFQSLAAVNKYETRHTLETMLRSFPGVVLDRYTPSAYAYGGADGLSLRWLGDIHATLPSPDLTVFFSCAPEERERRLAGRRAVGGVDFYEKKGPAWVRALHENYERAYADLPPLLAGRVNSSRDPDETFAALLALVRGKLQLP